MKCEKKKGGLLVDSSISGSSTGRPPRWKFAADVHVPFVVVKEFWGLLQGLQWAQHDRWLVLHPSYKR